ncbi:SIMPL domain-containing protein [Allocoleopsis sp.]|uniref:SIMPL domain-containing protein n=1 Tax=Allocoleopsis sp. TaxID=3088169 RepID=UPI002FD4D666
MNRLLDFSPLNTCDRLKTLLLVFGLLSLTSCQAVSSNAQTPNLASAPRTLTVSGTGDVTIPTTVTQVRLGVEIQGKTAKDVQQQIAKRSQVVVELLKSRKVEKLETTGISLRPNYTYKDGKQTINGYTGTNTVSFRIDTDKSGTLLDDAIKAGATRIDGVSFVASDDAIAQAQQQAIQKAAEEAKKRADAALRALNLSQREVMGIQINSANPPQPLNVAMPMVLAERAQTADKTPVVGGEQKVQQSVTLQIRY